jgi:hypothetical protein
MAAERVFYRGLQQLYVSDCPECGVSFGMPAEMEQQRRQDCLTFCCPNGHRMSFPRGESWEQRALREAKERADKAERERDEATRWRQWAEQRAKGANIAAGKAKAAKARLERRIACGVCPECHRTFKQLADHMAAKHGTPEERRKAADSQTRKGLKARSGE